MFRTGCGVASGPFTGETAFFTLRRPTKTPNSVSRLVQWSTEMQEMGLVQQSVRYLDYQPDARLRLARCAPCLDPSGLPTGHGVQPMPTPRKSGSLGTCATCCVHRVDPRCNVRRTWHAVRLGVGGPRRSLFVLGGVWNGIGTISPIRPVPPPRHACCRTSRRGRAKHKPPRRPPKRIPRSASPATSA